MNQLTPTLSVRIEPVQQRSTERITTLLDAAAQLIDELGIEALTTSNVATTSGSSVGVLYRYFPNIESLLIALASRNLERFTSLLTEAASQEPASVDHIIDAYSLLARTEPGFRALRFGAIVDERFIQPHETPANKISELFSKAALTQFEVAPSEELNFDLEVLVEIVDTMLHRAFLREPEGDERFITKLRTLVDEYMAPYAPAQ